MMKITNESFGKVIRELRRMEAIEIESFRFLFDLKFLEEVGICTSIDVRAKKHKT